ncbi:RimK family alpha-L-glutamate ligase [Clostridium nigeriense]|uniref:ATP-grasp domain-containing protein n=1 Tax=Clostridium nigeriense TaxID=1805470 RepID=UPI000830E7AC|nr:ATP-grasp domain-containing protein [Clostridium nigeriense]
MINGIVIYNEEDVEKNKAYINWLIVEGKSKNLNIKLVLDKDIDELNYDYKFAINRSRNFDLTYRLEEKEIRVFNKYKFAVLGNDKLKAYDYIESKSINYPKVYRSLNEIYKEKKIIEKPKNGHGGNNIRIVEDFDNLDFNKNVYQDFIEDYIGDIRFYIINNKIEHAVIRIPKRDSLVSNFTKGGSVEIYNYSNEEKEIINKILKDIKIDFGGIDFLLSKDRKILFNEFEDAVGSRMLSHLGINDTMDKFLNHIVNEIKRG